MTTLNEITNYFAITDNISTSGQPTQGQFADIAASGHQLVINLALPSSDHALANEGSIVTELGMSYLHIPVKFDAPTLTELQLFCRTMHAWQDQRVWVHCVVNARVSAFTYLYLHEGLGLPKAQCRSPVLEKWEPKMDDVWRQFLRYQRQDLALS